MVDHSVNEFYTWFLFKIDALPQDVTFTLDIAAIFFNNLSPKCCNIIIDISGGTGSPKATNWNQSPGKPYATPGQKCISESRK